MYINNLIIFSGVAYERVVEKHLFSLVQLYALLLSPIDGPKEQQGAVRECVGHTNKLVIGVNSGILSQQTPPDNSVSIMPTRYSRTNKTVSVRGRAAKATDGRFLDVGPISIPTQAARRNRWF